MQEELRWDVTQSVANASYVRFVRDLGFITAAVRPEAHKPTTSQIDL